MSSRSIKLPTLAASATRVLGAWTAAMVMLASARAASPNEPPSALVVSPAELHLVGPRAMGQLLVSGLFEGDQAADLTHDGPHTEYTSLDARVVQVSSVGLVTPAGTGETEVVVRHSGHEVRVPVRVDEFDRAPIVDFRSEVVPALARGGCSQGACHGSPQGKNGFRLSLRGFDPELDFFSLARESFGRRTVPFAPERSLILLKATAAIPHQGGLRFRTSDHACQVLRDWVAGGCQPSESIQTLSKLEVLPGPRRLHARFPRQQIVALAHFADGTVRDVTHLAVMTSSDESAASVEAGGIVEFHRTAEATILVRFLDRVVGVAMTWVDHDPGFAFAAPEAANDVDRHVFARQRMLQIQPSALASDAVFLRRAFLDVIGSLPSPDEARSFLDSTDEQKRSRLIDGLLERPEFARFWALKWADVMMGNRETISERGVHNLHRYLVEIFSEDRPWSEVAREILTSQGNTIHVPAANFYRVSPTPEAAAESMAQLFLGVRIQCARCHNHPYETITQNDYYSLAAYFAGVQLKAQRFGLDDCLVFLATPSEIKHPATGQTLAPAAFGTPAPEMDPDSDRRAALADWLTAPSNPYFARSIVNRAWYHLLGRGIVEPIDDFRDTNPPSNRALLDGLASDFTNGGYRLKGVLRTILMSHTYQSSAEATIQSPRGGDPERYFAHALVRMLSAEQVLDAISQATGVEERFEGYPPRTRAIDLAEGAVSHHFLQAFSKPVRDVACECARETEPSLNQVLHLLNNAQIRSKASQPESRLSRWLEAGLPYEQVIEEMYLATLSRRPTLEEARLALAHVAAIEDHVAGFRELQHALLNTNEFLLRH